jgi:uncharacterized membrane protein
MILVAAGWLPHNHPSYRLLIEKLLPFALGLLLLGVDVPSIMRTGGRIAMAAACGAIGIVLGAPFGAWLLQDHLPPDAWKGAGTLAGTWTGGTMNLLALRSILQTPEPMFAPLIVVDAMMAYSWMALLVSASAFQRPINRWLQAAEEPELPASSTSQQHSSVHSARSVTACALTAWGLAMSASWISPHLPTSSLISSSTGWSTLLVTTTALACSFMPRIRSIGVSGAVLGYPCLYLVLAATGAQARLESLWSAPGWIVLGLVTVAVHGTALLLVGRWLRIPLGILATASQANIGGVVSAPLVGAVYSQTLVPAGLLLALAGNALGTYLGLCSAALCRLLVQ